MFGTDIASIENGITSFIQYVPKDSTGAKAHPLTPWDLAWYLCIPLIPGFLALVFYTAIRQLNRNIENHSVRFFFLYVMTVYVFVFHSKSSHRTMLN